MKEVAPKKEASPTDVFERIVYIVPYKDKDMIEKIEEIFYSANLKAFNMKNKRELTTYLLKPEEQKSLTLDYVTGIQICDPEGRLYMLEGLRDGAMK